MHFNYLPIYIQQGAKLKTNFAMGNIENAN